jgi:hypothetical protein
MTSKHPLWKPTDIAALLSWLDFCLQNDCDFDKTIIEHLKEAKVETYDNQLAITQKRICDKFRSLAKSQSDHSRALTAAQVRQEGSKCLDTLPADLKINIAAALKSYTVEYANMLTQRSSLQCLESEPTTRLADRVTCDSPRRNSANDIDSNENEIVSKRNKILEVSKPTLTA